MYCQTSSRQASLDVHLRRRSRRRCTVQAKPGLNLLDKSLWSQFRLRDYRNQAKASKRPRVCHLVIVGRASPRDHYRGLFYSREFCKRRGTSATDHQISRCQGRAHLVNIRDKLRLTRLRLDHSSCRRRRQGVQSRRSLAGEAWACNDQELNFAEEAVRLQRDFSEELRTFTAPKDEHRLLLWIKPKSLMVRMRTEDL